jgi:hypothetical protein
VVDVIDDFYKKKKSDLLFLWLYGKFMDGTGIDRENGKPGRLLYGILVWS